MDVSIVLPCFNEARRLPDRLPEALAYFRAHMTESFELLFVDDGSTDETAAVLRRVQAQHPDIPIVIERYPSNRGKGYAVRYGVLRSRGGKILVMDADFSISLAEMEKCLAQLDRYDIVVGSKKHGQTQTVKHQRLIRRWLGKSYTVFINYMLGLAFTDITCGLKGFRGAVARDLFRRQRIERWGYDAETLFLARQLHYRTAEVPVRWHHIEGSKVFPLVDVLRSAYDLGLILLTYWSGGYHLEHKEPQAPATSEAVARE